MFSFQSRPRGSWCVTSSLPIRDSGVKKWAKIKLASEMNLCISRCGILCEPTIHVSSAPRSWLEPFIIWNRIYKKIFNVFAFFCLPIGLCVSVCERCKINGNRPMHILIYRLHGWVGGDVVAEIVSEKHARHTQNLFQMQNCFCRWEGRVWGVALLDV